MNTSFDQVKNWPAEAKRCGYRVKTAAARRGISRQWFEIQFKKLFGESPHKLFARWRKREMAIQARTGKKGQKMLEDLGYSHLSCLSRSLAHDGLTLRKLRKHR